MGCVWGGWQGGGWVARGGFVGLDGVVCGVVWLVGMWFSICCYVYLFVCLKEQLCEGSRIVFKSSVKTPKRNR